MNIADTVDTITFGDLLRAVTMRLAEQSKKDAVQAVPAAKAMPKAVPAKGLVEKVTAAAVTSPRRGGRVATTFDPKLIAAIVKAHGNGATVTAILRENAPKDSRLSTYQVKRILRENATTTPTVESVTPTIKHGEANPYRRGRRPDGRKVENGRLLNFWLHDSDYQKVLAGMKKRGFANRAAYIRAMLGL